MNDAVANDVFANEGKQGSAATISHNFGHKITAALQHTEHNRLADATLSANLKTAHECLVNLDLLGKAADLVGTINRRHVLADFVSHAPCSFVSDPKLALQFLAAHAVARGGEQVNGVKPQLQGRPRLGEGCSDCGVQVMSAKLAGIGAFCLYSIPAG